MRIFEQISVSPEVANSVYGSETEQLMGFVAMTAAGGSRIRKSKQPSPQETQEVEQPAPKEQGEKVKEELDELLDEIDSVLEENAEEFVRNYVQKGGQ